MTVIVTRAGKGSELTHAEVDANFTNLQTTADAAQVADADLTTIAGLTATTDSFMQSKSSAWASRTIAQVKTDLSLTGTNSGDQTAASLGLGTGDSPQFTAVNLGHASDSTVTRVSAGLIAVEGSNLLRASDIASDANIRAAAAGDLVIKAASLESAAAAVALTDGANIALDWDTGINFTVTLAGNRTLDNPTNEQVGTWRRIQVTQDGTGTRTLALGSEYVTVGDAALALTTAAASVDVLMIYCRSSTIHEVYTSLNVK